VTLRFDAEQRFSCRECARCCRRGWDIAVTPAEVEAYRKAHAERWYRESEAAPEGAWREPFEAVARRSGVFRIRKRADGACGFLSAKGRCRIHEELGGDRKPLTCRLFPFRFHPGDSPAIVTASFCCPTVVNNDGLALGAQLPMLEALRKEWARAFAEPESPLRLTATKPLPKGALATIREALQELLCRRGAEGSQGNALRMNAARAAQLLEDWTRSRVLRLDSERLAEYLELTGRFAARSQQPPPERAPSRTARVLFRGFLFAAAALRLRLLYGPSPRVWLRVARVLLHLHGLGPAAEGYDLPRARRVAGGFDDPEVAALASHYLRAALATLGTGRRPVLDEVALAFAYLEAGRTLAAMKAAAAGKERLDAQDFAQGLMDAHDLTHVPEGGLLGRSLGFLAGGVGALDRVAAGAPL
jgi:Fe-S-cluster containining protein